MVNKIQIPCQRLISFLHFICRANMNRNFLSTKIFTVFLIFLSACGLSKSKDKQNIENVQVVGENSENSIDETMNKFWDHDASYLAQQVFALNYELKLDNDTSSIIVMPRDEDWAVWDLKLQNSLPIVVSKKASNSLIHRNLGFPVLQIEQVRELESKGTMSFIDPVTNDTISFISDNSTQIAYDSIMVDGFMKKVAIYMLKGKDEESLEIKILASYPNPIVIGLNAGYTYNLSEMLINVPEPAPLIEPSSNMVLHYTASSAEGIMDINVRIRKNVVDTIICSMRGTVYDSYKYSFNNTVVYGGEAFKDPQFVPFLPSLILDTLYYSDEGMCFIASNTLDSWYANGGGEVGLEHFIYDENPSEDVIDLNSVTRGYLLAYKHGKQKFGSANILVNGINKEFGICEFANYPNNCFLEILPSKDIGIVYRASSTDMMWNIQLQKIEFE